jgi:hypothetical protein
MLNGRAVSSIGADLQECGLVYGEPHGLSANKKLAFEKTLL